MSAQTDFEQIRADCEQVLATTPDHGWEPIQRGLAEGRLRAVRFGAFGFIIYSIEETGALREFFVHVGKFHDTRHETQIMSAVLHLARSHGCERIRFLTPRRALVRRLRRHGFRATETIEVIRDI